MRPWPVTLISVIYSLSGAWGVWSGVRGEWVQLIFAPLYLALGVGLFGMKEWARRGTVLLNGIFGVFVTVSIGLMWVMLAPFLMIFARPLSAEIQGKLFVATFGSLSTIVLLWAPFVYLRQPSVKTQFRGLGLTV